MFCDAFGLAPNGKPMAEIWFGTHHGSLSVLADNPNRTLLDELDGHQLPFLVKFLGIDQPLSMQVHPTSAQAAVGFNQENIAGIPLDAPHRNYKDAQHKPEIVIALQDGFKALCGFRPQEQCIEMFEFLGTSESASTQFRDVIGTWIHLLTLEGVQALFTAIMTTPKDVEMVLGEYVEVVESLTSTPAHVSDAFRVSLLLRQYYPNDPGVLTSLLMNNVTINKGEALFLPAGNIHAYLHGLGFEVMAASDNVIRGGLTPKHIDVDELLKIVNFSELPVPFVRTHEIGRGAMSYPVTVEDFTVTSYDLAGESRYQFRITNEAIMVCASGSVSVVCGSQKRDLVAGHCVYTNNVTDIYELSGNGQVFIVSVSAPSISI